MAKSVGVLFDKAQKLHQTGRLTEAAALYQKVLARHPNQPEALLFLGLIAHQRGNHNNAIPLIEKALAAKPDFPLAYNNLGVIQLERDNPEAAVNALRQAVKLEPQNAESHYNLGNALRACHLETDAETAFRAAIALLPTHGPAFNNLGSCLKALDQFEAAANAFQRAIQLMPDNSAPRFNCATVLARLKRLDDAVAMYENGLALEPNQLDGLSALSFHRRELCRWDHLDEIDAALFASLADSNGDITPFFLLPSTTSAAHQLAISQAHTRFHCATLSRPSFQFDNAPKKRLTIGYLSDDFQSHATMSLATRLFEKHNRERFQIVAYSTCQDDASEMRQRAEQAFDRFVDLHGESHDRMAQRIHDDQVDILVDLKGYTLNAPTQVLALKPAPIQVNFLGYPGTMGADFMDYLIADPVVAPMDYQPFYTEKLVHLPHCYQPNDDTRSIQPDIPGKTAYGLPEDGFVFCCFNANYKISPRLFSVWMALLSAQPDSVLWLLESNRWTAENLRREAKKRYIDPARIVFAPPSSHELYLAQYRHADLFLDTYPVAAHTTASDALWGGCPLLTLMGETFASRVAGSILTAVGLPELLTHSLEEYRDKAQQLSHHPEQLAELRSRLATHRKSSPLFDSAGYTRHLEQAYERMWQRYQAGGDPVAFAVSDSDV